MLLDQVEHLVAQLQRALVAELPEDVPLHLRQVALGVDEVEVEDLPQRLEGVERRLLERPVAVAAQVRVEVGDALLQQLADAGLADLAVVLADLPAALQLPLRRSPPR